LVASPDRILRFSWPQLLELIRIEDPLRRASYDIDDVILVEADPQPWCVTPLKIGEKIMLAVQSAWPTAPGYPCLLGETLTDPVGQSDKRPPDERPDGGNTD
jgi:hypothetical protein